MSGYHYNDQAMGSCNNGCTRSLYFQLKDTTHTDCGPSCLCRFNRERSEKDKILYQHFVQGKPFAKLLGKKPSHGHVHGHASKYGTL